MGDAHPLLPGHCTGDWEGGTRFQNNFLASEFGRPSAAVMAFMPLTDGQQMTVRSRHANRILANDVAVYDKLLNGKSRAAIQIRGRRFSRIISAISWFGLGLLVAVIHPGLASPTWPA
jgi:hypothetical protein